MLKTIKYLTIKEKLTGAFILLRADTHTFYFGALNLDLGNDEPGRIVMKIPKGSAILYPEYNASHFNEKNIALVHLPAAITLSRKRKK
jgi:hypothetical protein